MRALLLIILLLNLAVTGQAQTFTTSTASGVDLRSFDTFTVTRGEIVLGEDAASIDKEALHQRLKNAIAAELKIRGYRFVEDSAAQWRVSYLVKSSTRMDVVQLGPMGQRPTTNPADMSMSQDWSREFRMGSLFLEIEDAARKVVIWTAEGVMDATRTRGGNVVDIAVQIAFRKFPDKNKKEKPSKKKKS